MRKIVDYVLVATEEVHNFLPEWQPYGSPFCGLSGKWYQAIVKYEETKIQDMGPK